VISVISLFQTLSYRWFPLFQRMIIFVIGMMTSKTCVVRHLFLDTLLKELTFEL